DLASRGTAHCENAAGGLSALGLPLLVPDDGIPDTVICDDAFGVWQVPTSGMPLASLGLVWPNGSNSLRDAQGNPLMFGADGSLITWEQANLGTPRGAFFSVGSDAINNPLFVGLSETNNLIAPLDRYIINATGHREVLDGINLYAEALFARTESANESPDASFGTVVFGPGIGGVAQLNIAENPYISTAFRDVLVQNGVYDPTLADDQYVGISRSNMDIGSDSPDFREQNVYRFVVGLDGSFPLFDREWTWDTSLNFGQTNATVRQTDINGRRLALAIDSVRDPGTGDIVCRSQLEPPPQQFPPTFQEPPSTDISDCVPFNPIGIQELTAEQRAYLQQQDYQSTTITQETFEFNVAGDLVDLPAGPMAFAGGYIRRQEDSAFRADRASTVGFDPLTPVQSVAGGYTTDEFYAETLVPLIEKGSRFDVPLIASLQLEAAIRWVDNSLAGKDTTWTVGGRLRPDLPGLEDSLTIRGNFTTSIRAPSVQELFLPRSEFSAFADDPCDDEFSTGGPNPAVRQANCAAEVAARQANGELDPNFQLEGFVSLAANRGFPQFTGGNQNLKSEEAESWTAGIVFSPDFVPGLTVSADWTDITINNEIARLSATQIMNACYDSVGFPALNECTLFERDFDFQVVAPQTGFLNAASRNFAGLIANFNYDLSDTWVADKVPGDIEVFGSMFHVAKHERNVTGSSTELLAGERGFEEWRSQFNMRWTKDRIGALWQARFIGAFKADAQAPAERFSPGQNGADSTWIHNATLTYKINEAIGVRLVVDNIFDNRDSAERRAQTLGGTSTLPFSPLDVIGRRFALSINGEF
ncbi:MAG: TonB-dependent receptor, partial [Woeseia sp.]